MTRSDKRKGRRADPPYMAWRSGAPRWQPGPALRRHGWRNILLVDEAGDYLPRGAARRMARAINEDVARIERGEPPRRFRPDPDRAAIVSPAAGTKSLAHAWENLRQHRSFLKLSWSSQDGYRKNLAAFLDWTGEEHPANVTRADLSAWFEARWDRIYAIRALGWTDAQFDAAPRARDANGATYVAEVRRARWAAIAAAREDKVNVPGQAQMNGHIRAISRLYTHIWKELQWTPGNYNPAADFDLIGLKPRLRLPTDKELAHMVETADRMDMPGVGDAIVYTANMGPRPADLVRLPLAIFDAGVIDAHIRKTGARLQVKISRAAMNRATEMRQRRTLRARRQDKPLPVAAFLTDIKAVPWTVNHLDHKFIEVRKVAATTMPSCADLTLYDFRKLAITRLHLAGNSRDAIAAVTTHSYRTIDEILNHYIVPTRDAADGAIDRLDDYMEREGLKW